MLGLINGAGKLKCEVGGSAEPVITEGPGTKAGFRWPVDMTLHHVDSWTGGKSHVKVSSQPHLGYAGLASQGLPFLSPGGWGAEVCLGGREGSSAGLLRAGQGGGRAVAEGGQHLGFSCSSSALWGGGCLYLVKGKISDRTSGTRSHAPTKAKPKARYT